MEFAFAAADRLLFLVSPCIILYAGACFLEVKSKGAYWIVGLAALLATAFCPFILTSPWRVVTGAVVLGAPMLLFARDIPLRRLLVVASLLLIGLAADIASLLVWYALSTTDAAAGGDASYQWGVMALSHGTRIVVSVGLLALFSLAYRHMSHLHTNRGALVFGGFIVVQLLLLAISVVALMGDGLAPRWFVRGLAVATVLSALVDVLLFLRLYRFNYRELQERRAEILQHELDHYLQQYEAVEREIRLVGRLRHDLRNQVNVAMLLAQQGEPERACEHLGMLIDEAILRSAEAEAPVAADGLDTASPVTNEAVARGASASAHVKAKTAEQRRFRRPNREKRSMGGGVSWPLRARGAACSSKWPPFR